MLLIPALLVLCLGEHALARSRGLAAPDARGTLANLCCGVSQLSLLPLYQAAVVALYAAAHAGGLGLRTSARDPLAWAALFLGTELAYYGYHRLAHRVGVMWAWHGVHHQSPAYDLSVAIRLSWVGGPVELLFYLPFAALGFAPEMIVAVTALRGFYQFALHTRLVGRLGPLEWVLATPSNHRVHHGAAPPYRDRNFGAVVVLWDHVFGTYEPERAEPAYGAHDAPASYNPGVANVHGWTRRLRGARGATEPAAARVASPPGAREAYVAAQLALQVAVAVALHAARGSAGLVGLRVAFALASAVGLGAVLDARRWALPVEALRWSALGVGAAWALGCRGGTAAGLVALGAALAGLSAGALARVERGRSQYRG